MKIKKIVPSMLVFVILICVMFAILLGILSCMIFGFKGVIIMTKSMTGEINQGDWVLIQKIDIDKIEVGDNILFYSNNLDVEIVHKVISKNSFPQNSEIVVEKQNSISQQINSNSSVVLQTAGIYPNLIMDEDSVTKNNYLGKAVFVSSFVGFIYKNMILIFIGIIIIILILFKTKNIKNIN